MTSWDDYCLNAPTLCTPLPVMRGLVSALCERREAVDSTFHASCVSSGASHVIEERLTHILGGGKCDDAPQKIPFRKIRKEYTFDEIWSISRTVSFMHMFDAFLVNTLGVHAEIMGYRARGFTDSMGNRVYETLDDLASALSEGLVVPGTVPLEITSGMTVTDSSLHICLNAAWAAQRTRMLKLLRYASVSYGGFIMRYASLPDDNASYGASPQDAYGAISSWTLADTRFAGWETPMDCMVDCRYIGSIDPDERWIVHSAWEIAQITPDHQGCLVPSEGRLMFDAVDLQPRDGNGNPVDNGNTYVFDPLCTTVSSGANTLVLSNNVFASWGYGSASDIGGPDTEPGNYIRGWQARNIQVIYDYETTFNFKQGE